MKKQRLYHSNFNHMGWRKKKGEKSRAHNLRAKQALANLYMQDVQLNEICDPDLIKNNILYIPGENGKMEKVNSKNGDKHFLNITKQLEIEKKEYIEKLENAYTNSNKAKLSTSRAKAKAALKRYADGSTDLEKAFWLDLTERLGTDEIDPEQEIAKLKATTDGKIKRFNQKIKRINELSQYNDLLGIKSRNTEYTIFSKEVLYKIPDDTDLNVKPMDMANFVHKMNQRLYPDFQATYIAIHADENPDRAHAHCEFSGKNLKTGEMDIQQQLFLNLEREFKKKNKPFPYSGRTYNDLGFEEVKNFGEVYQDYIFEELNEYLQKKGYNAKLEKRTEKEKKNDHQKFLDKHKPTQKREYTRAKKLEEENKKANKELKSSNKKIIENKEIIKDQNLDIDNKNNEIEEKQTILEKINDEIAEAQVKFQEVKQLFSDGYQSIVEYAKNKLPTALYRYIERQEEVDKLNIEVGNELHKKAINIQRNEEDKNKVRNSRKGKGNRI